MLFRSRPSTGHRAPRRRTPTNTASPCTHSTKPWTCPTGRSWTRLWKRSPNARSREALCTHTRNEMSHGGRWIVSSRGPTRSTRNFGSTRVSSYRPLHTARNSTYSGTVTLAPFQMTDTRPLIARHFASGALRTLPVPTAKRAWPTSTRARESTALPRAGNVRPGFDALRARPTSPR